MPFYVREAHEACMNNDFVRNTIWKYRRFSMLIAGVVIILAAIVLVAVTPRQNAHADTGDWTTFLGSNARTNFNAAETAINPSTAPKLALSWSRLTGGRSEERRVGKEC